MNFAIRSLTITLLGLIGAPARAAEPPADIASLFPPTTLAYAEVHNPAELAPQLASVFKGTVLEDSIPFIHGSKDSAKTLMELTGKERLALVGLLTSPEVLAEFKKLRIAAALTGFTENGDPEGAIVILTHDSPATGLAARAFITMSSQLRKVGEVSKVPVFQFRAPNISYDPNGNPKIQNDKPLTDGPFEVTVAYTPGLFVIGTSKTAVGHAVKRFAGEEKGDTLLTNSMFKEAATAHRQTGLFYFINFPEFVAKSDAASRVRGGIKSTLRQIIDLGESDLLELFKMTANAKAVKSIAGNIRFHDSGVLFTAAARFDATQKSPLLELLSGPGVSMKVLHHARRPATFALSFSLPGKNRGAALVGFLDSVAKASGELGRLPSDVVKDLTEKQKLPVVDELVGKVQAITVVLPAKQELPKGGKAGPMILLTLEDASSAGAWEEFVPKLIGNLGGVATVPPPSIETINGVKVFTVTGHGLRWNAPLHFAHNGNTVALGLDRKLVAQAVVPDQVSSVIGGDNFVSQLGESVAAYGVASLGEAMVSLIEGPRPEGPIVPRTEAPPVLPNGNPIPEGWLEEVKKARKELLASLETLPLATVAARRVGNDLRIELFQPKVQNGGLKTLIDAGARWIDKSSGLAGVGHRHGDLEIIKGRW